MNTAAYYRALLVALACGVGAFVFTLWYADDRAVTEKDKLCAVIYQLEERAGATLGLRGTPGYMYYKNHPTELRLARKESARSLEELPCGPP